MKAQSQMTDASAKAEITSFLGRSAGRAGCSERNTHARNGSGPTFSTESQPGGPESTAKRLFDVCFSFCGLLFLSPLLVVLGALIKIADGGPIFYRQVRVGRGGQEFLICKFRTMLAAASDAGPSVTKDGDSRITWIGRILRKTKLDELPQLWNVLKGDMSLVGPRPEVPRYVRLYTPEQMTVLEYQPGITDLASLCFRDEEALLANASNLEEFYLRHCLPRKLRLNLEYARNANLLSDTWIILQTVCPYRAAVLMCYGILLAASYWLASQLVDNFPAGGLPAVHFGRELCVVLGLQLVCLTWRNQHRGLLSYFSFRELGQMVIALGVAATGLLVFSIAGGGRLAPNIILIDALLALCVLAGFRLGLRRLRERTVEERDDTPDPRARVGIIGAGSAGAQLALELTGNRNSGRRVVAFFDDDFHKWQRSIHNVPVAGMPECLLDGWAEKLDEVVIAVSDAPTNRVREIEQLLRTTSLKYYLSPPWLDSRSDDKKPDRTQR